jgi:aminoglycoside phosphotransferase (APT) family kinase protein
MRERQALARRVLPHLLTAAAAGVASSDDARWRLRTLAHGLDGPLVLGATLPGEDLAFVVKVATDPAGIARLDHEASALRDLHRRAELAGWRGLLPVPVSTGREAGCAVLVTSRLPGTTPALPAGAAARDGIRRAALDAIAPLHALTTEDPGRTRNRVDAWVVGPADRVARAAAAAGMSGAALGIRTIADSLAGSLEASTPVVATVHGDYWPENLLVNADGGVTGIVDWEAATAGASPVVDTIGLSIAILRVGSGRHTGEIVAALLDALDPTTRTARTRGLAAHVRGVRRLEPADLAPEVARHAVAAGLDGRDGVLLAWLAALDGSLARRPSLAHDAAWLTRNIAPLMERRAAVGAA